MNKPRTARFSRIMLVIGFLAIAFVIVSAAIALHYRSNPSSTNAPLTRKQLSQALQQGGGTTVAAVGFASVHRLAPSFSLPSLMDGKVLSLGQFSGKPIIVNFWASWCTECRSEMPAIERVAKATNGQVTFLGVDTADQSVDARNFARAHGATYPIVVDSSSSTDVTDQYGVSNLPTTFFLSSDAKRVIGIYFGAMSETDLASRIGVLYHIKG